MASDSEKHDNSIFAPIADALTELRVEKHLKVDKIVMDTGIAKSTICSFATHKHAMRIDTILRLLAYMDVEMFELIATATPLSTNEMRKIIDKVEIKRKKKAKNKDHISPNMVKD